MTWDSLRFQELESKIMLTAEKKRISWDVPFIRFRYEPHLELHCISEFVYLAKRLRAKEISTELIWINELLLGALETIDTLDNLAELEKSDRQAFLKDLSHVNQGLTSIIAKKISTHLGSKDISHCAIFLRVGSLFPFVHISPLLTLLEGTVNCMIIIPYPGKDGEMLNYKGDSINGYYRGEII